MFMIKLAHSCLSISTNHSPPTNTHSFHKTQGLYYFNLTTNLSQWDHPLDDAYKQLVDEARIAAQQPQTSASAIASAAAGAFDHDDTSTSLLDSGIRSGASLTNNSLDAMQRSGASRTLAPLAPLASLGSLDRRHVVKLAPLLGAAPRNSSPFDTDPSMYSPSPTPPSQHIDLKIAPAIQKQPPAMVATTERPAEAGTTTRGLQLFGTGSMFLKSNSRKASNETTTTSAAAIGATVDDINTKPAGISGWAAASVKGILRDSSLSDVKVNRDTSLHRDRPSESETTGGDDRKSVRFNLARRSGDLGATVKSSSDDSDSNNDVDYDDDEENAAAAIAAVTTTTTTTTTTEESPTNEDDGVDDDAAAEVDDEWDFMKGDRDRSPQQQPKVSASTGAVSKPTLPLKQTLRTQFSLDDYRKPLPSADRVAGQPTVRQLGRTFSTDSSATVGTAGAASSLFDRKARMASVKPLYDDTTDSESVLSAGGSGRPAVTPPSSTAAAVDSEPAARATIRRQMDERLDQFRRDMQREQRQQEDSIRQQMHGELAEFRVAANRRGSGTEATDALRAQLDAEHATVLQHVRQEHATASRTALTAEQLMLQQQLDGERRRLDQQHQQQRARLAADMQQNTDEYQAELATRQNLEISNHEQQLKRDFERRRAEISEQHRGAVDTLQRNHAEIFADLERDLKSEAELLRGEHGQNLAAMRAKLEHELEMERQRMRDAGEQQQFEKLRCEKRLLEDKYRCLKEKYMRMKTDFKLRMERQGLTRRCGQHPQQQSQLVGGGSNGGGGSETDRSFSLLQRATSEAADGGNGTLSSSTTPSTLGTDRGGRPPAAPLTPQLSARAGRNRDKSRERRVSSATAVAQQQAPGNDQQQLAKPFGAAVKYLSHLHHQHQTAGTATGVGAGASSTAADDTTSFSQSDTTVSNNFSHTLGTRKSHRTVVQSGQTGDNGNSDTEAFRRNQENNNHAARDTRKKQFTRMKSASTSRLNATHAPSAGRVDKTGAATALGAGGRPCTPMESLRRQLQKLEDLEDQFPENTLLLDATHPYHLRYPFKDAHLVEGSSEQPASMPASTTVAPQSLPAAPAATAASSMAVNNSSELEFIKHRVHMERDSVRRAKEALRTQRTNFRMRQRELKHTHGGAQMPAGAGPPPSAGLDVLIEEAKELTDMEVSLHRTRALLGEKVIRLRHLEQSLQRICEKEKPAGALSSAESAVGCGGAHKKHQNQNPHQVHHLHHQQQRDVADATVSDLSSHSSSGFSSTEYATDTMHTAGKRGGGESLQMRSDTMDIVQSLEHLNAEIREIWEILSKQRTTQGE